MTNPTTPAPPSTRTPAVIRRALLAVAIVGAMAAPTAPWESAGAQRAGGQAAGVVSWGSAGGLEAGIHRLTLLTGDVVALQVTADGRQAAWVEDPVDPEDSPHIYEADGQVHVVPAEAAPYVASGVLDENLFNVTLLARDGYDDAATEELPLLVEAPDRAGAAAMPVAPDGTDEVRELDSINTVSVTADKTDIRSTWTAIRGDSAAAVTNTDAQLAGDRQVWLNGRVEATLDESVAQIGAPEAWADGYDGDGVTVAVLDTGYDPTHPDLAGRVVDAQNFTDDADPTGEVAVDDHGHGTHVAATVGGTGAASGGDRKGVAPATDLIIGKVLDASGSGSTDQIIAGMEWAAEHDADVINMSIGTTAASDGTDPMSQAVNELTTSTGSLFVVAAGNTGPGKQTVGSPGAADLALTVGAVDKDDEPAAFSSRGPRLGDGAIKPEITAPGVDIVAARAAGTSLGNLLDEHYTSLNGTSMATPHVAGAAAILAQQHPDWTAAQLKARLISTSKTLPDQPVTFQGGGRVDVAAAVRRSVSVDDGTVYLGRITREADPVTRELTYHNASDQQISLRLSAEVTGTGSDASKRPALTFDQSTLKIPAHGSASVTATLRPQSTAPGSFAGQIVARPSSGGPVHTTMAFAVEGPTHTLTIDALDRNGQPATGPVDLWSAETGDEKRVFLKAGTATFEVPDGLYSVVASIEGAVSRNTETTIAAEPELRIGADRTVRFDAREGQPIRVVTPRRSDLDIFNVLWQRSVGDHSASSIVAQGTVSDRLYALRSSQVTTGAFRLATEWQLQQPLLTVEASGALVTTSQQASQLAYENSARLPLVDAGDGSPDAFAAVDADGAAALVSRQAGSTSLLAQAQAAAAAGAKVLLAYNTAVDRWTDSASSASIPVYRLEQSDGESLLDAIAGSQPLVDLHGVRDSIYQYELTFTEVDRVPGGHTYDVSPRSLATVVSDFHQNSDRQRRSESWIPYIAGVGVANAMSQQRSEPLARTDYLSTRGVDWQRFGSPSEFPSFYWTGDNPTSYEAGDRDSQVWWGPLVHPAVPPPASGATSAVGGVYQPVARYRDAIRINLPHYSYGDALAGTIYEQFGDRSQVTLERDGEVLGTSTWPRAQWTVPADRGWYDLTLDVTNGAGNWSDTSVRTSTTWHFASARTEESGVAVPLVQVDYELATNSRNEVPSDVAYPLTLRPTYQPQADGPGRFTAQAEVSFDDGATWQSVPVDRVGGRLRAEVPAATGPGYVSVRVVVADADGNQLSQRIDRAWKIAAP
ncbi:MAG TPA: S8 family peptidase [Nocardioidaceae bacterium]|nr:S8 family peptidase [Nocardioidaceae bacterium]